MEGIRTSEFARPGITGKIWTMKSWPLNHGGEAAIEGSEWPGRQEDAPVTVRSLAWSTLLGLSLLGRTGLAAEPAPINLPTENVNQGLADAIASQLRQSAILRHYTVDVRVHEGQVVLLGQVTDQAQREEVHRLVQGVPGVVRVVDQLTLTDGSTRLVRAQGPSLPPSLPDPPAGSAEQKNAEGPKPGSGPLPEPTPLFSSPAPGMGELNPPRMPPYAWPTYAPHNNYSRVAYPQAYPWQSWPFIGPVYPFPKVPLGWRSVKLEWDDGYWWYGQVGNKYNWWKLRYW